MLQLINWLVMVFCCVDRPLLSLFTGEFSREVSDWKIVVDPRAARAAHRRADDRPIRGDLVYPASSSRGPMLPAAPAARTPWIADFPERVSDLWEEYDLLPSTLTLTITLPIFNYLLYFIIFSFIPFLLFSFFSLLPLSLSLSLFLLLLLFCLAVLRSCIVFFWLILEHLVQHYCLLLDANLNVPCYSFWFSGSPLEDGARQVSRIIQHNFSLL